MSTRREKITLKAIELIKDNSNGIHYSELMKKIHQEFPDIPLNTIQGTIWNLDIRIPDEIYKPVRGLFRHTTFRDKEIEIKHEFPTGIGIKEEDFYKPFADWLISREECTKAIPLGGNKFRDKWGTPDVIGIRKSLPSDIISSTMEVLSAEIKTDTKDLITAFGQACSYKLFSHKSYLVIPKNSPEEDVERIDSLCMIFGIGLILFNSDDKNQPEFEFKVRPVKHEPDLFYTNKYLKIPMIEKELVS